MPALPDRGGADFLVRAPPEVHLPLPPVLQLPGASEFPCGNVTPPDSGRSRRPGGIERDRG
ncbi:MAG TPA: hypothetical protein DHT43_09420 [Deltaproteobacteria bacterium]|nr:hypothetical protein [Deltaproteobacteria bacterium]